MKNNNVGTKNVLAKSIFAQDADVSTMATRSIVHDDAWWAMDNKLINLFINKNNTKKNALLRL